MIRRTVHFSGDVQGVGFRYTAQAIAGGFHVKGYVQNLSDGRVRLVVEADETEVDRFVEAIQRQMRSYIRNVEQISEPATGEFAGFSIRH